MVGHTRCHRGRAEVRILQALVRPSDVVVLEVTSSRRYQPCPRVDRLPSVLWLPVLLLGLRQDITEDEPRPPDDFTDLDADGAREDRPLDYKRVELAVFAARVHSFR
jgi:hypothetical protein